MAPELKRRRVVIELGKIDEILSWERAKEQEKGSRFAVLGEYLITQSPMNSKRLRQKRPRHKLDPTKYAIWTRVLERDGLAVSRVRFYGRLGCSSHETQEPTRW